MTNNTDYSSLFLTPPPSKELPVKVLEEPSEQEREFLKRIISDMTVESIKPAALMFLFLQNRYAFRVQTEDHHFIPHPDITAFSKSVNKLKPCWVNLMVLLCHKPNFRIFFQCFTPQFQMLWTEVMQNVYVSAERMNHIMGEDCVREGKYLYQRIALASPLNGLFQLCSFDTYGSNVSLKNSYIHLANPRLQALCAFVTPDEATEGPFETEHLPWREKLEVYNAEGHLLSALPIMPQMLKAAGINPSDRKHSVASIKKLADMLQVPELFSPSDHNAAADTAKLMLCKIIASCSISISKESANPIESLKILTSHIFCHNWNVCDYMLPHIRGKFNGIYAQSRMSQLLKRLELWLCSHPEMQWIPVKLIQHDLQTSLQRSPAFNEELPFQIYQIIDTTRSNVIELRNTITKQEILPDDYVRHLGDGTVLSCLALLALSGMLEIAYVQPGKEDISPFSGIRYVRVTDLFLHLQGKKPDYHCPQNTERSPNLTLDEARLLIHVQNAHSPLVAILKSMTERLSPSMLRMDFATLFDGCRSPLKAIDRIALFCQIFNTDMQPPIWKDFILQAKKRTRALRQENKKYLMLTIPAENKELQHLLLTQPELRGLFVKGEQYTILIEEGNIRSFSLTLRKFGYIL